LFDMHGASMPGTATDERELMCDGMCVLSVRIARPEAARGDRARFRRRFDRFYSAEAKAFIKYCGTFLYDDAVREYREAAAASREFCPYEASLSYRTTFIGDGLISVVTDASERYGRGTPATVRRGDVWDTRGGYPLSPASFFGSGARAKKICVANARLQAARRIEEGTAAFLPKYEKLLRKKYSGRNFYIAGGEYRFFYPMCSVAPESEGVVEFSVPFSECGAAMPRPAGGR
jgi:hypothetical protein